MGLFEVKVTLANVASPECIAEASLLVNTGVTLSWIPRVLLEALECKPVSSLPFTLTDGRTLERETTAVLLTVEGRRAAIAVAFGEPSEEAVLGATALETLGLMVDPVARRLVPRSLFAYE